MELSSVSFPFMPANKPNHGLLLYLKGGHEIRGLVDPLTADLIRNTENLNMLKPRIVMENGQPNQSIAVRSADIVAAHFIAPKEGMTVSLDVPSNRFTQSDLKPAPKTPASSATPPETDVQQEPIESEPIQVPVEEVNTASPAS